MSRERQELGRWGENLAAQFLMERGYVILERNVRTAYGEIDLIVQKTNTIVFVEVKTRSSLAFGYPEEAITQGKMARMVNVAEAYLLEHPELEDEDWQIDVIAVHRFNSQEPKIFHFTNVSQ
jgi:putative endonuclease